jgi:hypothetical protein
VPATDAIHNHAFCHDRSSACKAIDANEDVLLKPFSKRACNRKASTDFSKSAVSEHGSLSRDSLLFRSFLKATKPAHSDRGLADWLGYAEVSSEGQSRAGFPNRNLGQGDSRVHDGWRGQARTAVLPAFCYQLEVALGLKWPYPCATRQRDAKT